MQYPQPQRPPVAQLYPPEIRDIERIDMLTDNLAARGFARQRSADAMPSRPGWHA